MRLKKEMIEYISHIIVNNLVKDEFIIVFGQTKKIEDIITNILTEDLSVEDRLDKEVRELIKSVQDQVDEGSMDYHQMFQVVKKKLIKEKGLIL